MVWGSKFSEETPVINNEWSHNRVAMNGPVIRLQCT